MEVAGRGLGVDSGQIMIIRNDEDILSRWTDDFGNASDGSGLKLKDGTIFLLDVDFSHWGNDKLGSTGKSANELLDSGEAERYTADLPMPFGLGYETICGITLRKDGCGLACESEGAEPYAFATSTAWGDGCYPIELRVINGQTMYCCNTAYEDDVNDEDDCGFERRRIKFPDAVLEGKVKTNGSIIMLDPCYIKNGAKDGPGYIDGHEFSVIQDEDGMTPVYKLMIADCGDEKCVGFAIPKA